VSTSISLRMLLAGCALSVSGCMRDKITVPAPLPEPPAALGTSVRPMLDLQEAQGEATDFVIYEHEFVAGTARLNPAGEAHLRQIGARAALVPFPILVENSSEEIAAMVENCPPCAELDAQRRNVVVAALTMMGVPAALSAGLPAAEAERAFGGAIQGNGAGGGWGASGASGAGGGVGFR
jgi:hypothetical protein